jgi:thiol-disulfide isomerase/thioredoxin
MSLFCIGGVCIPYSALLPILLVLLQPVWDWICKALGIENHLKGKEKAACTGDSCALPKATTASAFSSSAEAQVQSHAPLSETPFHVQSEEQWKQVILASKAKPVLVRFTAPWCGPCKKIEPLFTSLGEASNGSAYFCSVDVDEFPDLMSTYQITGIPYFLKIVDGSVASSYKGSNEDGLKKLVE